MRMRVEEILNIRIVSYSFASEVENINSASLKALSDLLIDVSYGLKVNRFSFFLSSFFNKRYVTGLKAVHFRTSNCS